MFSYGANGYDLRFNPTMGGLFLDNDQEENIWSLGSPNYLSAREPVYSYGPSYQSSSSATNIPEK